VHVSDIFKTLSAQLRPMGYVARIEKSLQIRRAGKDPIEPRPDVMIYDSQPARRSGSAQSATRGGIVPLADLFPEDWERPTQQSASTRARPLHRLASLVAWLEQHADPQPGITDGTHIDLAAAQG
ncbi:MAG: hypothetical protein HC828_22125, partial [Blastochloris sp.]|nr:hypothetical protein [Blastochloris sp.]